MNIKNNNKSFENLCVDIMLSPIIGLLVLSANFINLLIINNYY